MKLQTRLYLTAAVILVIGFGSAISVYLTAPNDTESASGYEVITPENSKTYAHDLELFGGKTNVLAVSFMRWFTGLWQGKSLAVIIAGGTIVISFTFFIIARRL
jgi:hypothetical protein